MRTVMINGGSRGIGAAMVRIFAQAGYRVAFTYSASRDQAEALAREVGALPVQADSGILTDVVFAVDTVIEQYKEIDVLINNAAISSFSLLQDVSPQSWERMLAVNVSGPFWYCQKVLPGMISRKNGAIINISSVWGVVGAACEAHYSTTKAALLGLTKALAKEVGPSGITVNAIAPGVIKTEMNRALSSEALEALREETPLGRMGNAEEVAELALFLAGEKGRFITGQVIGQNGGFSIS